MTFMTRMSLSLTLVLLAGCSALSIRHAQEPLLPAASRPTSSCEQYKSVPPQAVGAARSSTEAEPVLIVGCEGDG